MSEKWTKRIDDDGAKSGVFAEYSYYGVGDRGGAPTDKSVDWIEQAVHSTGAVQVASARSDQMFRDITDAEKARLPKYKGDLLLTEHSAASINSEGYMKRWNRKNEQLADAAERASVAARAAGGRAIIRARNCTMPGNWCWPASLRHAPGHEPPKGFRVLLERRDHRDEQLRGGLAGRYRRGSAGSRVYADRRGTPLVVYNPLSDRQRRCRCTELALSIPAWAIPRGVHGGGSAVPTQVISNDGGKCHFIFPVAKAPSVGVRGEAR